MEVNRLRADELNYELRIRGASEEGTVDERRARLRQRLYLEKHGSFAQSFCHELDADAEISICEIKLNQLAVEVSLFDTNNATNERSRILTRLLHVSGRLNRLVAGGLETRKDALIAKCAQLCETLDMLSRCPETLIQFDQQDKYQEELINLAAERMDPEPNMMTVVIMICVEFRFEYLHPQQKLFIKYLRRQVLGTMTICHLIRSTMKIK